MRLMMQRDSDAGARTLAETAARTMRRGYGRRPVQVYLAVNSGSDIDLLPGGSQIPKLSRFSILRI
jgi:hypothetical protein